MRWGDMDALGHVNNARYFTYLESARIGFFASLALDAVGPETQAGPVLATAALNFRQQVRFPATLVVAIQVIRMGTKSFTLGYQITELTSDTRVADGDSVVVWFDYRDNVSLALPDALRHRLAEFVAAPVLD